MITCFSGVTSILNSNRSVFTLTVEAEKRVEDLLMEHATCGGT